MFDVHTRFDIKTGAKGQRVCIHADKLLLLFLLFNLSKQICFSNSTKYVTKGGKSFEISHHITEIWQCEACTSVRRHDDERSSISQRHAKIDPRDKGPTCHLWSGATCGATLINIRGILFILPVSCLLLLWRHWTLYSRSKSLWLHQVDQNVCSKCGCGLSPNMRANVKHNHSFFPQSFTYIIIFTIEIYKYYKMYLFFTIIKLFKLHKISTLQDRDEALATLGIKAERKVEVWPFMTRLWNKRCQTG